MRIDDVRRFVRLACIESVVRRSLKYALLVGSVLIVINHGGAILHGDLTLGRVLQMGLTVLVPYLVSTSASVSVMLDVERRASGWAVEGEKGAGVGGPEAD